AYIGAVDAQKAAQEAQALRDHVAQAKSQATGAAATALDAFDRKIEAAFSTTGTTAAGPAPVPDVQTGAPAGRGGRGGRGGSGGRGVGSWRSDCWNPPRRWIDRGDEQLAGRRRAADGAAGKEHRHRSDQRARRDDALEHAQDDRAHGTECAAQIGWGRADWTK